MVIKNLSSRRLSGLVFSGLLLLGVFFFVQPENLLKEMGRFPLGTMGAALGFIIVNQLLVVHRYRRILNHFGFEISWGPIFRASMLGNLAGLVVIPLMGHVVGRQSVLKQAGISPVENAMIVAYERVLVALVSAAMAVLGGGYLLGSQTFQQVKNIPFVEILLILSIAGLLSWRLGLRLFERRHLAAVLAWSNVHRVLELLVVTLISLGAMLACFALLFHVVAPDLAWLDLFAMAALVSFGASIPLSFGGWGLREIAAVYVLGLAGVAAGAALSASILCGLLSILGILVLAGLAVLFARGNLWRPYAVHRRPAGSGVVMTTEHTSAWFLYMAAALLIFFQIHVTVSDTTVNLNLADPFAILALSAVALDALAKRRWPDWSVPWLNACLLAMWGILLLGLAWAWWLRGSVSGWAVGKVIGWAVLLGYLAAGYMAVHYYKHLGFRRLVEILVLMMCVVVVCAAVLAPVHVLDVPGFVQGIRTSGLEAYSGNRNALAFQLLVVLALYVPLLGRKWAMNQDRMSWLHVFVLGILAGGIFLTASRSAFIALALMSCVALALRIVRWRMIFSGLAVGLAFWWLAGLVPMLWHILMSLTNADVTQSLDAWNTVGRFSSEDSDQGRMALMLASIHAWWQHPILGGGLGTFLADSVGILGVMTIIHNTLIWLLAEMGLVGAVPFILAFVLITKSAWRQAAHSVRAQSLLLLMLVFAVMSQFHEVLYQRIFWLGLGVTVAALPLRGSAAKQASADEMSAV